MPVLSNPKHERFAQELAKGKSATEAYESAGYKPSRSNASVLRQDKNILERIDEILSKREKIEALAVEKAVEKLALSKEWVLERLVKNVERAMQAEPVTNDDGAVVMFKYEGSVANKALELIGKELGMFIDRREVGGPGDFALMKDDELDGIIAEEVRALGFSLEREGPQSEPQGILPTRRPH